MAAPEARPDIIDAPLLKVPLESLKRAAKERKALLDEAAEALAALAAPLQEHHRHGGGDQQHQQHHSNGTPPPPPGSANGTGGAAGGAAPSGSGGRSSSSREAQLAALDQLVVGLQGLKRKLGDVSRQEAEDAMRVRARLQHLVDLGTSGRGSVVAWNKARLDRMLVDHMMRSGHTAAAAKLAQEAGCEALCELHIFGDVAGVMEALRRHDCGPALAWCGANRARLRKVKSGLEFKLRLQEFLELVRQDQRLAAVAYARTHLAPWASTPGHMPELQRALATLAFRAGTKVAPYRALFGEGQWAALLDLFLRELYRLHCLLPASSLAVQLQAGLVALKNPPSSSSSSREDPLHHPDFQALAADLPCAKHVHSKLICAVTRSIMSDDNPPMVLPNGYVYSARGIDALAARNGGRIVCPRTGGEYAYDEARRAYIV